MSYNKEARTAFANRAFVLSELFNAKFRNTRFSGAVTRVVKVIPPETESTGGGKMARESIALAPESEGAQGATVVCGWLDVGQNLAELRSFDVLVDRHKERFGNLPFDLEKHEYEQFLADAQEFLASEGITLTLLDETGGGGGESAAPARPGSSGGVQVVSAGAAGRAVQAEGSSSSGGGMGLMIAGAVLIGVIIGVVGVLLIVK